MRPRQHCMHKQPITGDCGLRHRQMVGLSNKKLHCIVMGCVGVVDVLSIVTAPHAAGRVRGARPSPTPAGGEVPPAFTTWTFRSARRELRFFICSAHQMSSCLRGLLPAATFAHRLASAPRCAGAAHNWSSGAAGRKRMTVAAGGRTAAAGAAAATLANERQQQQGQPPLANPALAHSEVLLATSERGRVPQGPRFAL